MGVEQLVAEQLVGVQFVVEQLVVGAADQGGKAVSSQHSHPHISWKLI